MWPSYHIILTWKASRTGDIVIVPPPSFGDAPMSSFISIGTALSRLLVSASLVLALMGLVVLLLGYETYCKQIFELHRNALKCPKCVKRIKCADVSHLAHSSPLC